jgi:hypothetical protein
MITFAAIDSGGQKLKPTTSRTQADSWAESRCAAGYSVRVFSRKTTGGPRRQGVNLVGVWEPLTDDEKEQLKQRGLL